MNDHAINSAIQDYVREHLSPTEPERDYVRDKYLQLREFLGHSCFKSGSFARFTAIHPMHDLDVIWITYNPEIMDNPEKLLRVLAADLTRLYKDAGGPQPKISVQTHSVTLEFDDIEDGFAIDVVPAIPSVDPALKNAYGDPIFIVPEVLKMSRQHRRAFYAERRANDQVSWLYSDPKGYIKQAKELDDESKGDHRKTAKLLKAWRFARKTAVGDAFKLKSFHSEQVCADQFTENADMTVYEGIRTCFNVIPDYIVGAPRVEDRAYALVEEQKYIDEYLDQDHATARDKEIILTEIARAAKAIRSLVNCRNKAEVYAVLDSLVKIEDQKPPVRVAAPVTYSAPARPWLEN